VLVEDLILRAMRKCESCSISRILARKSICVSALAAGRRTRTWLHVAHGLRGSRECFRIFANQVDEPLKSSPVSADVAVKQTASMSAAFLPAVSPRTRASTSHFARTRRHFTISGATSRASPSADQRYRSLTRRGRRGVRAHTLERGIWLILVGCVA